MRRATAYLAANALFLALFGLVVVLGAELVRPLHGGSVAFDSQATVLYFERIVSGQRLEAYVTTTPKPLMTVLYGIVFEVTRDWRSLAWLTIGVDALAVTLAAVLANRVAGPLAAGFVGLGLANNPSLLFDVGNALVTPYAVLALAGAALAMTGTRPRYALAGAALCAAALVRIETLVVAGMAALVLVAWWAFARRTGRPGPPGRAWLIPGIALLAIPILMVHDTLLTGDPLYWAGVAGHYSAGATAVPSVGQIAVQLGKRYLAIGAVTLLALLGVARLAVDRRHWLVAGLIALGPGVGVFLLSLAARHIVVPARYAAVIDVAVIFAGGAGLAGLVAPMLDRPPLAGLVAPIRARHAVLASAVVGGVVAIALTQPYPIADPTLRTAVGTSLRAAVDAARAVPVIRQALATPCEGAAQPTVLAPSALRPGLAVDLGLPLTRVAVTAGTSIDLAAGYPARCTIVLHVRGVDPGAAAWTALEVSGTTRVGAVTVEPLLVDAPGGLWVVAIR